MRSSETSSRFSLLMALIFIPASVGFATAEDALRRVPENVWGFVVVRDVARTNDKCDQLLRRLEVTFPAPWTFIKSVVGLDAGLDSSGDMVVALMPGANPQADPQPLVLLPISDYAAFAQSIRADTTGEICRITLLGEDILVAKDGSSAMLMNVEHRATMESLLELAPEPLGALSPLSDWLAQQDIALVMMPAGLQSLRNYHRPGLRSRDIGFEFSQQRSLLSRTFGDLLGPEASNWLVANAELAAVGCHLDNLQNLRVSNQLVPKANSQLSRVQWDEGDPNVARLGLSDEPFVFTAGGPVVAEWGKKLATWLRRSEQMQAAANGLENISTELWDEEEQAYQLLLADVSACSVVMLPGEKGEPLVGNFLGIATVPDTAKYLDSLPKVVNTWNEITQQSTSDIKPEFELTRNKIAGHQGYSLVVDVAAAARDPNTPAFNWMLESAFGSDGKMHAQVTAVDATTLAFGFMTEAQAESLLARLQQDNAAMPTEEDAKATLDLLQADAPWKMLTQPQGVYRWVSRVVNEFLAPLGSDEMSLPETQSTPPVGISLRKNNRSWQAEVVCPPETLRVLAEYLAIVRNL